MNQPVVGRITQLTEEDGLRLSLDTINKLSSKRTIKPDLINGLKRYVEDYNLTENDQAIEKVIDWLVNCTPDYK